MNQIYPKEFTDNLSEVHSYTIAAKSKIIYSIILLSVIIMLLALPFIKVDIHTSARGIIRPVQDRVSINIMNSGKVIYSSIEFNKNIKKGDTLLQLDMSEVNIKSNLLNRKINELQLLLDDLNYIINSKYAKAFKIKTLKLKKEFIVFEQKKAEILVRKKKAKRDLDRNKLLYKKQVIAKVEFENTEFEYNALEIELERFKKQEVNKWQSSLVEYENELYEVKNQKEQLENDKSYYCIMAPISGVLLNVKPLSKGSLINSGDLLAVISPNTPFIAECYIQPKDIGMIKENSSVNFQLDAYNYNQWGTATGKVIEIAKDIESINNEKYIFKVLCSLNEKDLKLKNGFKGNLKRGMTLNAQFFLSRRTLFELLYDRVDDWINPSQI
ncbi:HlyD family secretion protein [Pseudotamlana carrageenivorans]|uniref:Secretion protein HlyD n=1 Tax=Pseudotamlana carrageenivorans TaxID=2069432 RepID=A0A2I7SJR4_9FLAO|nr:HlyD family efflux transporter periplasmic adaptor subunit [Tamlana carrageenivorans]AUS06117.1 secretion protein HlyD [Tamlana carrageenivorans]